MTVYPGHYERFITPTPSGATVEPKCINAYMDAPLAQPSTPPIFLITLKHITRIRYSKRTVVDQQNSIQCFLATKLFGIGNWRWNTAVIKQRIDPSIIGNYHQCWTSTHMPPDHISSEPRVMLFEDVLMVDGSYYKQYHLMVDCIYDKCELQDNVLVHELEAYPTKSGETDLICLRIESPFDRFPLFD